jgi:hypothetical protein
MRRGFFASTLTHAAIWSAWSRQAALCCSTCRSQIGRPDADLEDVEDRQEHGLQDV